MRIAGTGLFELCHAACVFFLDSLSICFCSGFCLGGPLRLGLPFCFSDLGFFPRLARLLQRVINDIEDDAGLPTCKLGGEGGTERTGSVHELKFDLEGG